MGFDEAVAPVLHLAQRGGENRKKQRVHNEKAER